MWPIPAKPLWYSWFIWNLKITNNQHSWITMKQVTFDFLHTLIGHTLWSDTYKKNAVNIFDAKAQIQWTYWPWDENQKTLCKVLPLFTSVRCLHFRYLRSYCLWVNYLNIWSKSVNLFSVFVSTLTIVAIALDRCN